MTILNDHQFYQSYVINSYIGHYERHPQCPDVLRKWWKHVGEIPYNPIQV
jgi:hypothetical protein